MATEGHVENPKSYISNILSINPSSLVSWEDDPKYLQHIGVVFHVNADGGQNMTFTKKGVFNI